jgi:hypothetical protein
MKNKRVVIEEQEDGIAISIQGFGHPDHKEYQAAATIRWAIRALYHELGTNGFCGGCEHVLGNPVFCAIKDGPGPHNHPAGIGHRDYVGKCTKEQGEENEAAFKKLQGVPAIIALMVLGPDGVGPFMEYLQEQVDNPKLSAEQRENAREFLEDLRDLPLEQFGVQVDALKAKAKPVVLPPSPDWTAPKPVDSGTMPEPVKQLFAPVIKSQRDAKVDEAMKNLAKAGDEPVKKSTSKKTSSKKGTSKKEGA